MENLELSSATEKRPSVFRKILVVLVLLLLAGLAGAIFYVRYTAEQDMKKLEASSRQERTMLIGKSSGLYRDIQKESVELFSLPLSWSVRKELMKGDYEQIDEYFNELVRKEKFRALFLVDTLGVVKVATDRKYIDTAFSDSYPTLTLGEEKIASFDLSDGSNAVVIPIMGLSEKLGTAVVIQVLKPFPMEQAE
jgi:hypothetical protein